MGARLELEELFLETGQVDGKGAGGRRAGGEGEWEEVVVGWRGGGLWVFRGAGSADVSLT